MMFSKSTRDMMSPKIRRKKTTVRDDDEDETHEPVINENLGHLSSLRHQFKEQLKRTTVLTGYDIIFVSVTYDSTTAITLLKDKQTEYYIRLYDLESEYYVQYMI